MDRRAQMAMAREDLLLAARGILRGEDWEKELREAVGMIDDLQSAALDELAALGQEFDNA